MSADREDVMSLWRQLALGFVGMVAFWFAFWLLGASMYYGQRLEKHRLELLLELDKQRTR